MRLFLFLYFYLLMQPRPTISTLFPYTTLFRSSLLDVLGDPHGGADRDREQRDRQPAGDHRQGEAGSRERHGRDRKSTRLNSSHGYISYAVFCLKKKKKKKKHKRTVTRHKSAST